MKTLFATAIYWFAELLTTVLLVRCVFSWFPMNPDSFLGKTPYLCNTPSHG